jgi:hypothetical protein
MNRSDLQTLADIRARESKVLLDNGCSHGAYYLAGYAIECALKACIAKQVNRYDFPDKNLANKAFTHDLTALVQLAGLKAALDAESASSRPFDLNWTVVKDWSEQKRYESVISLVEARDMYSAVVDPTNGILPWLKNYW